MEGSEGSSPTVLRLKNSGWVATPARKAAEPRNQGQSKLHQVLQCQHTGFSKDLQRQSPTQALT